MFKRLATALSTILAISAQPALADTVPAANNDMGFDMLRHLDPGGEKNVFISPFSISSALTVTANGARSATLDAMRAALHLKQISISDANNQYKQLNTAFNKQVVPDFSMPGQPKPTKQLELRVANGLFVQKQFELLKPFVETAKQQFNATVQNVDFADPGAPAIINGWVSKQTNNKIPTIVSKLSPAMRLVIANAVYFKAPWQHEFSEGATQPGDFHVTAGNTIKIPLMHSTDRYMHATIGSLEVLRLPYQGSSLEMAILLPAKGSSVDQALKSLTPPLWKKLLDAAQSKQVQLTMPKFKVEFSASIKDALIKMGMGVAFTDKADFSGIAGEPLLISDVLHKTYLDVNEKGTEAAAATVVLMETTSAFQPQTPVPFTVDRPFIVAIYDTQSQTVLFIGAIRDPRK